MALKQWGSGAGWLVVFWFLGITLVRAQVYFGIEAVPFKVDERRLLFNGNSTYLARVHPNGLSPGLTIGYHFKRYVSLEAGIYGMSFANPSRLSAGNGLGTYMVFRVLPRLWVYRKGNFGVQLSGVLGIATYNRFNYIQSQVINNDDVSGAAPGFFHATNANAINGITVYETGLKLLVPVGRRWAFTLSPRFLWSSGTVASVNTALFNGPSGQVVATGAGEITGRSFQISFGLQFNIGVGRVDAYGNRLSRPGKKWPAYERVGLGRYYVGIDWWPQRSSILLNWQLEFPSNQFTNSVTQYFSGTSAIGAVVGRVFRGYTGHERYTLESGLYFNPLLDIAKGVGQVMPSFYVPLRARLTWWHMHFGPLFVQWQWQVGAGIGVLPFPRDEIRTGIGFGTFTRTGFDGQAGSLSTANVYGIMEFGHLWHLALSRRVALTTGWVWQQGVSRVMLTNEDAQPRGGVVGPNAITQWVENRASSLNWSISLRMYLARPKNRVLNAPFLQ